MSTRLLSFAFLFLIGTFCSAILGQEFDLILNAPPEVIGDDVTLTSGTQLNVFDMGVVGSDLNVGMQGFEFNTDVEVNIFGGTIGNGFRMNRGSVVNLFGGEMGSVDSGGCGSQFMMCGGTICGRLFINGGDGATIIKGGVLGSRISTSIGGDLEIVGGEFKRNGLPYGLSNISFDTSSPPTVFSGTLSDGTPFIFSNDNFDLLRDAILTESEIPPADLNPIFVDANSIAPRGLRSAQSLTLLDGGVLEKFFRALPDSQLNIEGGIVEQGLISAFADVSVSAGAIGDDFRINNSALDLSGGSIGDELTARGSSLVNISGGQIGRSFEAFSGSTINISGGFIDRELKANEGSTINVTGGFVAANFDVMSGGQVSISGGTLAEFDAFGGSEVELIGGEFRVNGKPFTESEYVSQANDVLSGTFADGTPFLFFRDREIIRSANLTNATLPDLDLDPIILDGNSLNVPTGLRTGQFLTLRDGGVLGEYFAIHPGATLNIESGQLGFEAESAGKINIQGGSVGSFFRAYPGAITNITGGEIGGELTVYEQTVTHVSGGTFEGDFEMLSGSQVTIDGGVFGSSLRIRPDTNVQINNGVFDRVSIFNGAEVNFSGGQFNDSVVLGVSIANISGGEFAGSIGTDGGTLNISGGSFLTISSFGPLNFSGVDFSLDGIPLNIPVGKATLIEERDMLLEGRLADGTPLAIQLNSSFTPDESFVDAGSPLTVTEIQVSIPGDVNQDGKVSLLDIAPFVDRLSSNQFQFEADVNEDGVVDLLDVQPFIDLLN